jgi:RNA polymerase sigma-70 factor, ECF subfamily
LRVGVEENGPHDRSPRETFVDGAGMNELLLRARLPGAVPRLRRFARSLARHLADADDLVQVTLERALRAGAQWRAPAPQASGEEIDASLRGWMFGIMKNAWIDGRRAQSRERGVLLPAEAGENVGDPAPAGLETQLSVDAALALLPDDQRLAVSLVLIEGLSYREAAEIADVPMGTLTSRLARGRTRLAELLGGSEAQ